MTWVNVRQWQLRFLGIVVFRPVCQNEKTWLSSQRVYRGTTLTDTCFYFSHDMANVAGSAVERIQCILSDSTEWLQEKLGEKPEKTLDKRETLSLLISLPPPD